MHEICARVGLCSPCCLTSWSPAFTHIGLALPTSTTTYPWLPSSLEPPINHPAERGLGFPLWGNWGAFPLSIDIPASGLGQPLWGDHGAPWLIAPLVNGLGLALWGNHGAMAGPPTNLITPALSGLAPVCVIALIWKVIRAVVLLFSHSVHKPSVNFFCLYHPLLSHSLVSS